MVLGRYSVPFLQGSDLEAQHSHASEVRSLQEWHEGPGHGPRKILRAIPARIGPRKRASAAPRWHPPPREPPKESSYRAAAPRSLLGGAYSRPFALACPAAC